VLCTHLYLFGRSSFAYSFSFRRVGCGVHHSTTERSEWLICVRVFILLVDRLRSVDSLIHSLIHSFIAVGFNSFIYFPSICA
jgi:hypothetical protein